MSSARATAIKQDQLSISGANSEVPIVIVGAGPVGVRMLQELRREMPGQSLILYGEERYTPYNRVQLSGLLAGQHSFQDLSLASEMMGTDCPHTEFRQARVVSIDPTAKLVTDSHGVRQPYASLILATGSRPFVPAFIAHDLGGVYTFRDMADAEKLAARRVVSKHTVVLGAGLLGIEAARAMQRHHTKVTLIDHNAHPMFRQLDATAGGMLAERLRMLNIDLLLETSIRMVLGTGHVEAVILRDGTTVPCDTLITATGIKPNRDLAEQAGLAYGRGITVTSQMMTSKSDIYAIGECCELDGQVFGLVAPGYEQASIVARNISNNRSSAAYTHHLLATSLKVAGLSVFSLGEADPPASMRTASWRDGDDYRRLTFSEGRLVSINAIGDWPELPALRDLANGRRWVAPWRIWEFRKTGNLLGEDGISVSQWPATAIVCNCNAVCKGDIQAAIQSGADSVETITAQTQAGSGCGSCQPLLQELLGTGKPRSAARGATGLNTMSIAALFAVFVALLLSVGYPTSVQLDWNWGELWRVESNKQISGFTILGLCVASLIFSLRKRVAAIRFGDFAWWRIAHISITILAFVALGLHTGFRMGSQLNFLLSLTFMALLVAGTLLGISIACEHRLESGTAIRLRRWGLWSHILLSWPLPALLAAHILKTYYF